MPAPDFEQLARQILTTRLTFSSASEVSIAYAVPQLAEQLRQVWNARGAADLALMHAEFAGRIGPTVEGLVQQIRSLNR